MAKTHAKYVMDGVLPDAYRQQVHGSMYVTGLDEWHFFSYFPTLNPLHVIVKRDDYTEKIGQAMDDFRILYSEIRAKLIPGLQTQQNAT